MRYGSKHSGFTLLELSIVLIIISLVTGMAITSGVSVLTTARLSSTQQKMATIEKALMQYRSANDRLPCPGDLTLSTTSPNYGLEAGSATVANGGNNLNNGSSCTLATGTCAGTLTSDVCQGSVNVVPSANFIGAGVTNLNTTAAEGALPALTLGLPADFMIDSWGNRFRYSVDASMTATSAFSNTSISCNTGAITIKDANGNSRSTGSVYALISHGPNGHGAYTKNGQIINAGSSNTNELINCHCSNTGATTATGTPPTETTNPVTYVQAVSSLDSTNSLNNFDDIVSYRERWQMQTAWDRSGNIGCGTSVIAFVPNATNAVSNNVYFYTISGTNAPVGTISSVTFGYESNGAYSPDGTLFYLQSTYQGMPVYAINPATGLPTGILLTNVDMSSWTANYDPVISSDGLFIIRNNFYGAGPLLLFQKTGSSYTRNTTATMAGAAAPVIPAFDPYANHMAVGVQGYNASFLSPVIYKRSGSTFTRIVGQPASLPGPVTTTFHDTTGTQTFVAFSPDGTYLYATDQNDTLGALLRIYTVSGDIFTYLSGQPTTQPKKPGLIAVSPNNIYIATAVATGASPYVNITKRSGNTFTKITPTFSGLSNQVTALTFTKDGNYLALSTNNSPYLRVYKINYSTDTFTALPNTATVPSSWGVSVSSFR